jgi:energy-coupling factor transporter ATP-binding protein EcfA2
MSEATSDLQNGKQILVIAISGPSSSGKSTLASLLGIIFQSDSETNQPVCIPPYTSPSSSKIYIPFCVAWNSKCPTLSHLSESYRKASTFPYFKIHRKPGSFPHSENQTSLYTFYIREICTILSFSPFVTCRQDNIGVPLKHKANKSLDSNPPRQLFLPRQESKSCPHFCIYQSG